MALVRRPGPRLAEGIVTHLERSDIDLDLAETQWSAYVGALRSRNWEIVEVAPADQCPDAVFIEDTAVMFDRLAVVTSDLTTLDLVQLLSPEDYETLTAAGWPYNNGFLSAGL